GTAPSLSYALSLAGAPGADSNLDSNGASIFLYDINGVIVGSTATDQAGVTAGNTIFEISVDAATGVVTLTQHAEIDHTSLDPSPTGTPFEDHAALLADGLVNLTATATITDGDGDTATDSAVVDLGGNIRFLDDGPSLDVAAAADAGVVLTTRDANTDGDPTASDTAVSTANFSGVFSIASSAYGADGAGTAPSLSYALSLAGAPGADSRLDRDRPGRRHRRQHHLRDFGRRRHRRRHPDPARRDRPYQPRPEPHRHPLRGPCGAARRRAGQPHRHRHHHRRRRRHRNRQRGR